jgi:hypothetical protein
LYFRREGATFGRGTGMSVTVNDVHAQLNEASVSDVIAADGVEAIQEAILRSASEGTTVAVAGGRHAMGGQ